MGILSKEDEHLSFELRRQISPPIRVKADQLWSIIAPGRDPAMYRDDVMKEHGFDRFYGAVADFTIALSKPQTISGVEKKPRSEAELILLQELLAHRTTEDQPFLVQLQLNTEFANQRKKPYIYAPSFFITIWALNPSSESMEDATKVLRITDSDNHPIVWGNGPNKGSGKLDWALHRIDASDRPVWIVPKNILDFYHFEAAEWRLGVANDMLDVLIRLAREQGDEEFWREKDRTTAFNYRINLMSHPPVGEVMSYNRHPGK